MYKYISKEIIKKSKLRNNFLKARNDTDKFKACVRYFSLFLKEKCISSLFQTKYIEKKFNLQLFFLPIVS